MRSKLEPVTDPTDDAVIREYWRKKDGRMKKDTISGWLRRCNDRYARSPYLCVPFVRPSRIPALAFGGSGR